MRYDRFTDPTVDADRIAALRKLRRIRPDLFDVNGGDRSQTVGRWERPLPNPDAPNMCALMNELFAEVCYDTGLADYYFGMAPHRRDPDNDQYQLLGWIEDPSWSEFWVDLDNHQRAKVDIEPVTPTWQQLALFSSEPA